MPRGPFGGPRPLSNSQLSLFVTVGVSDETLSSNEMVDIRAEIASQFRDSDVGVFKREPNEGDIELLGDATVSVIDVDIIASEGFGIPVRRLQEMVEETKEIVSNNTSVTGATAVVRPK